jgi:hypothetical protein
MATTTPNYGWPVPTSTDYVKDGATAIEALGDAIDATVFGLGSSALTLVKTQAVGSAVSNVTVTGAFNSSYTNYLIMYTDGVGSIAYSELRLQLSGITANYYSNLVYTGWTSGGPSVLRTGSQAEWQLIGAMSPNGGVLNVTVTNPNIAKYKSISGRDIEMNSTMNTGGTDGFCASTSTATGFVLSAATGTITGGTIRVYGYAN